MEMVLSGASAHGKVLKFSIFFEEGPIPYPELFSLGIGRGIIKNLPSYNLDPKDASLKLHTKMSFLKFVDDTSKFIMVKSKKSDENTHLFMFEKLWLNKE